jgi:hypothetical protein
MGVGIRRQRRPRPVSVGAGVHTREVPLCTLVSSVVKRFKPEPLDTLRKRP